MMACEPEITESERPEQYSSVTPQDPVYLLFSLDGREIDPVVETLDRGHASFACTQHFEAFYQGQMIGPAVLSLQNQGMAVVYPVVKSKSFPVIDVEFMEIAEKDRHMIGRFLDTCSGGQRPPVIRRTVTATIP
jgi:hypothetical protein